MILEAMSNLLCRKNCERKNTEANCRIICFRIVSSRMSVRRQGYEDLYPLGSSGYGGHGGGYGGGGTSISIDLCQVNIPIMQSPNF